MLSHDHENSNSISWLSQKRFRDIDNNKLNIATSLYASCNLNREHEVTKAYEEESLTKLNEYVKMNCESGDDEIIPLGRLLASLDTAFGEFWVFASSICNLAFPLYFWLNLLQSM